MTVNSMQHSFLCNNEVYVDFKPYPSFCPEKAVAYIHLNSRALLPECSGSVVEY